MSADPDQGTPPVVFETLALGRTILLGELYDQRSGKFLGVQLYTEDQIRGAEVDTDVRHTELNVSLSSTQDEKATVLDVSASLSLSILGGAITVEGSARYLSDEKSNTQSYAYAMYLKTRLKEKRLLFSEKDLGRNVIRSVLQDYIMTGKATHFVSSVVLGGSLVINLVAKQSEFASDDLIEGKLRLQLEKLKGAITLEGEASAEIKEKFKNLDDRFDVNVHGDVVLGSTPVNPKDVLDSFPSAAKLLRERGGVPVSVILQPIPQELHTIGRVYELHASIVNVLFTAFSDLDDLQSRFVVLQDKVKQVQDFVPDLVRTIYDVFTTYNSKHTELRRRLGTFLLEYQHGEKPDHDALLQDATNLYKEHLDPNVKDLYISPQYPSTLVGLEVEFTQFHNFVSSVQKERRALRFAVGVEQSLQLSSLKEVVRSIVVQRKIPLFIMTPLSDGKSKANLDVLKYLAILRKYVGYFSDSANHPYLFYGENLGKLQRELPNYEFSKIKEPILLLGTVDDGGDLTWIESPPVLTAPAPDLTIAVRYKLARAQFLYMKNFSLGIDPVDATKSYSILIQAKALDGAADSSVILLQRAANDTKVLSMRHGLVVFDEVNNKTLLKARRSPQFGKYYIGVYVQDTVREERILYLDGDEVARERFRDGDIVPDATKLQFGSFDRDHEHDDRVFAFMGFKRALTKEEVKAFHVTWDNVKEAE